jgi:hypothetical protein
MTPLAGLRVLLLRTPWHLTQNDTRFQDSVSLLNRQKFVFELPPTPPPLPPPPSTPPFDSPPQPLGPVDTSSVNDPSGWAEGSAAEDTNSDSGSKAMHVHHPGCKADVAGTAQH